MDLKQIEYILKIAEEKNVSRAALKLFISQSALNQQLLKLEKELGAPLFYRTRHNWELTEIGELYVQGAREILLAKQNTYNQIADILDHSQRSFSLGIPAGRGIAMFTSIYPRFLQAYPNVSISPLEIGCYDMQNMIASRNLDLGFITIGPQEKTNINYINICSEEFYIALPSSHPIAQSYPNKPGEYPELDLRLLRHESFVLMYQKSSSRALADSIFQEAGFSPNILFETSSATGIPSFVSSGICCALIPKYYTKNIKGISLFSLASHPYWELDFCYARQSYLSQPLKAFIELSRDYWKSYYEDLQLP